MNVAQLLSDLSKLPGDSEVRVAYGPPRKDGKNGTQPIIAVEWYGGSDGGDVWLQSVKPPQKRKRKAK